MKEHEREEIKRLAKEPLPNVEKLLSELEQRLDASEFQETKMAPRLVRIAVNSLAINCMAVSRVGGCNLTLAERWLLSTSP